MSEQPQTYGDDLLTPILARLHEREQAGKGINRMAAGLERIRLAELETLGAEDPARVVELLEAGYQVLLAQAAGDRPDNDMIRDRYQCAGGKGAMPLGQHGTGDPTAGQAGHRIALARVNGRLRRFAAQHRIRLPGDEYPETLPDMLREGVERMVEAGWTDRQIQDEYQRFCRDIYAGIHATRIEINRRAGTCKACACEFRVAIDEMLAAGATVREVEEWLQEQGEPISDSTIVRHNRHRMERRVEVR